MTLELAQRYDVSPSDVEIVGIDFADVLSSTETISTCTLTSTGTSGLTIGTPTVNTTAENILSRTVAVGKGVLYTVQGQSVSNTYKIRVAITTSASRVLNRLQIFSCK